MEGLFDRLRGLDPENRRETLEFLQTLDPQDDELGEEEAENEDEVQDEVEDEEAVGGATDGDTVGHGAPQQTIVVQTTQRPAMRKLRLFSGHKPTPSGEVDFESWHLMATQVLDDRDLKEADKKRTILQSLLRPALDCIRIAPEATAKQCVAMLKDSFGDVEDGYEMLLKCFGTYQDEKELASDYIQRLYSILITASDRGGIPIREIPRHLLQQFIRGCRDDSLIQKLKLEEQMDWPPAYRELVLSVRKEESRRKQKKELLKLGSAKVQSTNVTSSRETELEATVHQLQTQMAELQMFVRKDAAGDYSRNKPPNATHYGPTRQNQQDGPRRDSRNQGQHRQHQQDGQRRDNRNQGQDRQIPQGGQRRDFQQQSHGQDQRYSDPSRPRTSRICYNCGKYGHTQQTCYSRANPKLVHQRLTGNQSAQQNQQKSCYQARSYHLN